MNYFLKFLCLFLIIQFFNKNLFSVDFETAKQYLDNKVHIKLLWDVCRIPDFQKLIKDNYLELLKRISNLGISTPLIYGGGIRNTNDAIKVIKI